VLVAFFLFFLFGVAAEDVRREVCFLVLLLRADFVVLVVAMSLSFYCVWMWISRPVALVYPLFEAGLWRGRSSATKSPLAALRYAGDAE
jgi:hypothetical protein